MAIDYTETTWSEAIAAASCAADARQIVEQMSTDDLRDYTEDAWRDGVSQMQDMRWTEYTLEELMTAVSARVTDRAPWRVVATDSRTGERQDSHEVLGDERGRRYRTQTEARAAAESMTREQAEYGLHGIIYEATEVQR